MLHYVKLTALSIITISRPLTLLVLQISAVFGFVILAPVPGGVIPPGRE